MAGGAIADAGHQDADDLAGKVQYGRAALAALDGHVRPEVGRGKVFSQMLALTGGDHTQMRTHFVIFGKSNQDHGSGFGDLIGVPYWNEGARAVDFQDSDPIAFIDGDNVGWGHASTETHFHVFGTHDSASVGVDES